MTLKTKTRFLLENVDTNDIYFFTKKKNRSSENNFLLFGYDYFARYVHYFISRKIDCFKSKRKHDEILKFLMKLYSMT
jgi:hypothetical protein